MHDLLEAIKAFYLPLLFMSFSGILKSAAELTKQVRLLIRQHQSNKKK
ncbi:hypothetical protein [Lactobacillus sp. PSON]